MTNKKIINVGLVGYGMGGRIFHAPLINYVEGLHLQKIRETKQEKISHARSRYPQATIVSETSDIFHDPEIDLVVLAIPNKFHFELARKALENGKHVVIEKPFTVTSDEADELISLSRRMGKILTIYQNRRLDGDFLTVQSILRTKKLGRLVEYEAHYDRFRNTIRPSTWKEEGTPGTGLLYDLGSHLIDQALLLFGTPVELTAFISAQRDNSRIPDNFEILLHYDGLKVTLKSGMLVKEPLPKYILKGTHGAFVKFGEDIQEATLDAGKVLPGDPDWGKEPEEQWGIINYLRGDETVREKVVGIPGNYPLFYENLYCAIAEGESVMVKPEQARNTIRIIELAMESHGNKKTIPYSGN